MQPAIKVRDISKRYQLGLTHAGSVRELVNGAVSRVIGKRDHGGIMQEMKAESGQDHIWALRDVSFEVNPGEAIGIIGRNGAGKSTLLKILSRITRPTSGRIELYGRVASLLEVGTGFHPELTGRENVYMNGTILGMSKKEIRQQFDSIVEFAEVEKFIDTPVKRYSSGMTVRLGFAVAAHLNPEILIVDEVLAVGDAKFQKRCMGKMDDIAKSGRTILFVSHNMVSIRQLTTKCLLIDGGRLTAAGSPKSVIEQYLSGKESNASSPNFVEKLNRPKWLENRFGSIVEIGFVNGKSEIDSGLIEIFLKFHPYHQMKNIWVGLTICSSYGSEVGSAFGDSLGPQGQESVVSVALRIDTPMLAPGRYYFRLAVYDHADNVVDLIDEVLPFQIIGTELIPHNFGQWHQGWGSTKLNMSVDQL